MDCKGRRYNGSGLRLARALRLATPSDPTREGETRLLLSPLLLLGIARRRALARQSRVARCREAEPEAVSPATLAVARTIVAPTLAVR